MRTRIFISGSAENLLGWYDSGNWFLSWLPNVIRLALAHPFTLKRLLKKKGSLKTDKEDRQGKVRIIWSKWKSSQTASCSALLVWSGEINVHWWQQPKLWISYSSKRIGLKLLFKGWKFTSLNGWSVSLMIYTLEMGTYGDRNVAQFKGFKECKKIIYLPLKCGQKFRRTNADC